MVKPLKKSGDTTQDVDLFSLRQPFRSRSGAPEASRQERRVDHLPRMPRELECFYLDYARSKGLAETPLESRLLINLAMRALKVDDDAGSPQKMTSQMIPAMRQRLNLPRLVPLGTYIALGEAIIASKDSQARDFYDAMFKHGAFSEPCRKYLRVCNQVQDRDVTFIVHNQFADSNRSIVEVCSNARDFSQPGSQIDVTTCARGYTVRDYGTGIAKEALIEKLCIPYISGERPSGSAPTGKFGLGFMSVFSHLRQAGDQVTVRTHHCGEGYELKFSYHDDQVFVSPCVQSAVTSGTEITVNCANFDRCAAEMLLNEALSLQNRVKILLNSEDISQLGEFKYVNSPESLSAVGWSDAKLELPQGSHKDIPHSTKVSLLINGVTVEHMVIPADYGVKELVVDLPFTTRLPESRNEVSYDPATQASIKVLVECVLSSDIEIHEKARVINSLVALCAEMAMRAPKIDPDIDPILAAKKLIEQVNQAGDQVVPAFPGVENLAGDRNVAVSTLIPGSAIERVPSVSAVQEWRSGTVKLYVADFIGEPSSPIVVHGNTAIISRIVYERHKEDPTYIDLYLALAFRRYQDPFPPPVGVFARREAQATGSSHQTYVMPDKGASIVIDHSLIDYRGRGLEYLFKLLISDASRSKRDDYWQNPQKEPKISKELSDKLKLWLEGAENRALDKLFLGHYEKERGTLHNANEMLKEIGITNPSDDDLKTLEQVLQILANDRHLMCHHHENSYAAEMRKAFISLSKAKIRELLDLQAEQVIPAYIKQITRFERTLPEVAWTRNDAPSVDNLLRAIKLLKVEVDRGLPERVGHEYNRDLGRARQLLIRRVDDVTRAIKDTLEYRVFLNKLTPQEVETFTKCAELCQYCFNFGEAARCAELLWQTLLADSDASKLLLDFVEPLVNSGLVRRDSIVRLLMARKSLTLANSYYTHYGDWHPPTSLRLDSETCPIDTTTLKAIAENISGLSKLDSVSQEIRSVADSQKNASLLDIQEFHQLTTKLNLDLTTILSPQKLQIVDRLCAGRATNGIIEHPTNHPSVFAKNLLYLALPCANRSDAEFEFILSNQLSVLRLVPEFCEKHGVMAFRILPYLFTRRRDLESSEMASFVTFLKLYYDYMNPEEFLDHNFESQGISVVAKLLDMWRDLHTKSARERGLIERALNSSIMSRCSCWNPKAEASLVDVDPLIRPYILYIRNGAPLNKLSSSHTSDALPHSFRLSRLALAQRLRAGRIGAVPAEGLPEWLEKEVGSLDNTVARRELLHAVNHLPTGDPFLYIRELLQNSLDAIQATRAPSQEGSGVNIEINDYEDGDHYVIEVKDHVGMSFDAIRDQLLIAGASSKPSTGFRGKFGIGFMSVFNGAEKVEIVSGDGTHRTTMTVSPIFDSKGDLTDLEVRYKQTIDSSVKGTTIRKFVKSSERAMQSALLEDAAIRFGGCIDANRFTIRFNNRLINTPRDVLASASGDYGDFKLIQGRELALLQGELFVCPLPDNLTEFIPASIRDLVRSSGFTIDIPPAIELTRSRNDIARAARYRDTFKAVIPSLAVKGVVTKFARGEVDLSMIPYDYFDIDTFHERSLEVSREIRADAARINGKDYSIDWNRYHNREELLQLLTQIKVIPWRDDRYSLREISTLLANGTEFTKGELPDYLSRLVDSKKQAYEALKKDRAKSAIQRKRQGGNAAQSNTGGDAELNKLQPVCPSPDTVDELSRISPLHAAIIRATKALLPAELSSKISVGYYHFFDHSQARGGGNSIYFNLCFLNPASSLWTGREFINIVTHELAHCLEQRHVGWDTHNDAFFRTQMDVLARCLGGDSPAVRLQSIRDLDSDGASTGAGQAELANRVCEFLARAQQS